MASPDLIAFAKSGEIGPPDDQPVLSDDPVPFPHLVVSQEGDGTTVVRNMEKDVVVSYRARE